MAFLRKLSIRSQLLILAASAIAAILVIIFHTYSMMSGMITRRHEEYVDQTISEIEKNVASNRDVIFRLMQNISYNEDVQSYLVEQNHLQRFDRFKKLSTLISSQKELKDGILDIVISGNNGAWIDVNGGNPYVSPLKSALKGKLNAYYVDMKQMGSLYGSTAPLIFATTITYKQQGERFNTNVGTLFFILDPRALVGDQKVTLGMAQTGTQIYVLDRSRKVISSNTDTEAGSRLPAALTAFKTPGDHTIRWEGKPYVAQTVDLPDIGWSILSIAPKDELLRDLLDIRRTELAVLAACLLLLAVPFMFIMNNILRPLKKMIFFMTTAKRRDLLAFGKRLSLQGYMEISIMADEFNSLLDETEQLTQRLLDTNKRLYGTELEKKKSELAFLRSQINPHFLYNTLEAITGIAAASGQGKIKTMTRALSSIFRYSIKGADVVPLADELKVTESYVRIQQIRFTDRFTIHEELTEEARAYPVPKMILQPLVENAVVHGFEPSLKPGRLIVRGAVRGDGTLIVTVEDNGMGIEPERLQELQAMLAEPPESVTAAEERTSIGLVNVNNRIRLMCGGGSGLNIESAAGGGCVVTLTIAGEGERQHV
ncbi:sensor histidine kinase [Paenibacillus humicola]|uniref:sensor histidine kinase n=1 Tax=Paenibacillus humicola TaxID=3110540 RepID=UPI00237B70A8|nr:sensor histidine kinase [Paenibacillus humicola]